MDRDVFNVKKKSRFKKYNLMDAILIWSKYAIQWIWLFLKALFPSVFCSILYHILKKEDCLQHIDQQFLCNIAIAIFGFQITFFSIVLSNKNNRVLNENEIELNLFTNFFGQTINYYLLISIFMLFSLFFNIVFNNDTISSCVNLIVYSIIILVYSYYILKTSKAKLYFNKLKNQFNLFSKNRNYHKGNFINFVKNWDDFNENINICLKYGIDYNSSNIWLLWIEMKKHLFYMNTESTVFYIELFKYSNKYYFKNIRNDSNIILLSTIYNEFEKIILELVERKKYYAVVEIYKDFLCNYRSFLKSSFISNTFIRVKISSKNTKDMDFLLNYLFYILSFSNNILCVVFILFI